MFSFFNFLAYLKILIRYHFFRLHLILLRIHSPIFMKIRKITVLSLLPIISVWGQTNPSNADTPVLDESLSKAPASRSLIFRDLRF